MNELERDLRHLRAEVAWPATPTFDLAPGRRRATWLRPLAVGLAVALATLGAVLALSPGARSAFLELFRLQGATVERVEELPEVQPRRLDFGERVGRDEAERRVGFELLDLGDPDAVFVRDGIVATLVYGDVDRPRLVLSQLRGAVYEGFVKKAASGRTRIEEVTVEGEPGLFVSGADHVVMFRDADGDISDEETYLAGTVLLWNRGDLLLRLEGELTRDEALELASRAD